MFLFKTILRMSSNTATARSSEDVRHTNVPHRAWNMVQFWKNCFIIQSPNLQIPKHFITCKLLKIVGNYQSIKFQLSFTIANNQHSDRLDILPSASSRSHKTRNTSRATHSSWTWCILISSQSPFHFCGLQTSIKRIFSWESLAASVDV